MTGRRSTDKPDISPHDRLSHLSDEELMEIVRIEGNKDDSVLAKLIMIQRIRQSLVRERLWQRIMTGSAIILSVIALIVGVSGAVAFRNFLNDRVSRTETACRKDANDAITNNKSLEQQVDGLYFLESLFVDPVKHPDTATFLKAQVDAQVLNIRSNYQKVRDCNDSGIADYNRSDGKSGYLDGPQVVQAQRRDTVDVP